MNIEHIIGKKIDLPITDFNEVIKCNNLSHWSIRKAIWKKNKVELHLVFEKGGYNGTIDKYFDTIMDAIEYFYNFLKTIQ